MPSARRWATFSTSRRFGEGFTHRYLFPMASAIWSASLDAIRSFPALTLIRFFDNHGLLSLHAQPTWKVVAGGSHTYIPKLTAPLSGDIHAGAAIQCGAAQRATAVTLTFRDRPSMTFDEVVFACHGDQVLPLLADPSDRERDVFASFTTTTNEAWLHTDASVLPRAGAGPRVVELPARRRRRCAADGDLRPQSPAGADDAGAGTASRSTRTAAIDERQVLRRFVYRHPLYTREAIGAQRRWGEVSGVNRTHYCGAYWCYGFHEDGLNSALRVADALGSRVVIDSGLFVGTLRHRRFAPVAHAFTYPLFMALLDIDRMSELMRVSRRDQLQPLELGQLRRSRSPRRSGAPAPGTARRRRGAPRDRPAGRSASSC